MTALLRDNLVCKKNVSNTLEEVYKDGRGLRKKGKVHQSSKRRSAGADKVCKTASGMRNQS